MRRQLFLFLAALRGEILLSMLQAETGLDTWEGTELCSSVAERSSFAVSIINVSDHSRPLIHSFQIVTENPVFAARLCRNWRG